MVTLLGAGYTGQALIPLLAEKGIHMGATRRSTLPRSTSSVTYFQFDLSRPDTWEDLPSSSKYVWLFPAEPLEAVERFLPRLLPRSTRIVVIGTTSSYRQTREHELISEASPLDMESERVRGEELLRSRGAIVLRSAGIYGPPVAGLPARNPLDWLRRGRIAEADRYLNLVHVQDLAAVIGRALESSLTGDQFIVTDGAPRRWREIYSWAREKGYLGEVEFNGQQKGRSRRLTNEKLLSVFGPVLSRTDLFGELQRLERR
ncbi:MAG: hypothetical protein WBG80_10530 [Bacteroidota bacterium]